MVRFIVTARIQEIIQEYNVDRGLEEHVDGFVNSERESIDHLQLAHIATALRQAHPTKSDDYALHNILKCTSLYLEPKPKPKPVIYLLRETNDRILNIKPEWSLYGSAWSNKSTILLSEISNLQNEYHCFQMRV